MRYCEKPRGYLLGLGTLQSEAANVVSRCCALASDGPSVPE